MSWLVSEGMSALATHRRCFPVQPPLSDRQRFNSQKCAHLVQDLVAAAALPPRSAHSSLQLLNLVHKWSERQDNDIHIFDHWRPQSTYQNESCACSRSTARPPAGRLACGNRKTPCQTSARLRTGRCTQGGQFSKLFLRSIASWKSSTTSLQLPRQRHGSRFSNSAFPCGGNNNSNSRDARSFHMYLPACSLTVRMLSQKRAFGTIHLPRIPDPVKLWGIGLVLLWRTWDLSRTGRSPLEVTQRRFAPLLVVRHSTPLSQFCACCSLLVEVCLSLSLGECFNSSLPAMIMARRHGFIYNALCQNRRKNDGKQLDAAQ